MAQLNPYRKTTRYERTLTLFGYAADGKTKVPLAGSFTGAEALRVVVWAGDDQAPLWSSDTAVTWSDAPNAVLLLTILPTDLAALAPADYSVLVYIDPGGEAIEAFSDTLKVLAGPGTATARPSYCTADELVRHAGGWIADVKSGADQAGFAEQRADASDWLKAQAMARLRDRLEDQARNHSPVLRVTPLVPTTGWDSGPAWGPSTLPDTTLRDQLTALRAILDSTTPGVGLMQDAQDGGRAARIVAHYAAYLILRHQLGTVGDKTPMQDLAAASRKEAIRLLQGYTFRIDADGDGVADYEC